MDMMMMMMMMEGQDDDVVCCKDDDHQLQIIKGKRTKRPRAPPSSPPLTSVVASTTTTTTSSGGGGGAVGVSPTITSSFDLAESSTEEEEREQDMANCLLLLSQGQTRKVKPPSPPPSEPSTAAAAETDVHQCKTCNRCFPSFQALGGHRASHKKFKVVNDQDINNNRNKEDHRHYDQFNEKATTLSLHITSKKSRVHECSICGAEFSSGQALGGHMRRHRTLTNAPTMTTPATATTTLDTVVRTSEQRKKPRTVLQLDLNLPAPEDDLHKEPNNKVLSLASEGKLLGFSASSLVDCHY
ncbi:hypothetical protein E1A91_D01G247400v1 [Gossypium mustelinum]|uniref:C2H2-type domain-containing protein n=1 Tax=Gossypium mustelinum TaxID=34275 RepID=A0A5D2WB17_GOSMU|nr:hypothetical protein E1A91_D01G247400v1 [Gossypium mustelinum]